MGLKIPRALGLVAAVVAGVSTCACSERLGSSMQMLSPWTDMTMGYKLAKFDSEVRSIKEEVLKLLADSVPGLEVEQCRAKYMLKDSEWMGACK